MTHTYNKVIPTQEYTIDPLLESRLRLTKLLFDRQGFTYSPDHYATRTYDEAENEAIILMKEYGPKYYKLELAGLARVALEPNSFLNEKNEIIDKPSALKIVIQSTIYDQELLDKRNIKSPIPHRAGTHLWYCGAIPSPVLEGIYHNGKVDTMKIVNFNWFWHIEDSPTNIKHILKTYGNLPPKKKFIVRKAAKIGYEEYNGYPYSVYNLEEFMKEDIDLLIASSNRGLLSTQEGGVRAMKQWLKTEQQLINTGASSEQELSKISKEDILNLIHSKKSTKKQ